MTQHLSVSQLTLLLGITLVVGGLLVLVVFAFHKAILSQRRVNPAKQKSPRVENVAPFMIATMQAVIANLKEEQKKLVDLHRAAEERAEQSARINEIIAREMPTGLLIFDREGFLMQVNPAARALLQIDTWSRRRYPEILGTQSKLTARIQAGLETGRTTQWELIEDATRAGKTRALKIFLSPYHARAGKISGIVCLLTELIAAPQL